MPKCKKNVQLEHKIKSTSYISLPQQLVADIKSLNLSKEYTGYCYKFIGIIMRNNQINKRYFYDYSEEIPTSYIKKSFNGINYTKWLYPLLESEIIIRDNIFKYGNPDLKDNKILFYKINFKYFDFNNNNLSYLLIGHNTHKPLIPVGYNDFYLIHSKDVKYYNWFKDDMNQLIINKEKLDNIVQAKIKSITPDKFKINNEITNKIIPMKYKRKKYYFNRDELIEKATEQNLLLIKDGRKYAIDTLEAYISKKKLNIDISYSNAINSIVMKGFRATRNETNNRLDNNLTNISSEITDIIIEDNNLIQIDLSNSQFTILSWVLKGELDTDDYKLFNDLTKLGLLYDYISFNLGLKTRKEGKIAAFEIMFSSRKNNTENKKKIKELFPSVIQWIDKYKQDNGDDDFSVMLQQMESKIFIDNLLPKIKSKFLFCITKHDSLIIRKSDLDKILSIVEKDCFNKIRLEYNLEIK